VHGASSVVPGGRHDEARKRGERALDGLAAVVRTVVPAEREQHDGPPRIATRARAELRAEREVLVAKARHARTQRAHDDELGALRDADASTQRECGDCRTVSVRVARSAAPPSMARRGIDGGAVPHRRVEVALERRDLGGRRAAWAESRSSSARTRVCPSPLRSARARDPRPCR